jgi:hypothetical protein
MGREWPGSFGQKYHGLLSVFCMIALPLQTFLFLLLMDLCCIHIVQVTGNRGTTTMIVQDGASPPAFHHNDVQQAKLLDCESQAFTSAYKLNPARIYTVAALSLAAAHLKLTKTASASGRRFPRRAKTSSVGVIDVLQAPDLGTLGNFEETAGHNFAAHARVV